MHGLSKRQKKIMDFLIESISCCGEIKGFVMKNPEKRSPFEQSIYDEPKMDLRERYNPDEYLANGKPYESDDIEYQINWELRPKAIDRFVKKSQPYDSYLVTFIPERVIYDVKIIADILREDYDKFRKTLSALNKRGWVLYGNHLDNKYRGKFIIKIFGWDDFDIVNHITKDYYKEDCHK